MGGSGSGGRRRSRGAGGTDVSEDFVSLNPFVFINKW